MPVQEEQAACQWDKWKCLGVQAGRVIDNKLTDQKEYETQGYLQDAPWEAWLNAKTGTDHTAYNQDGSRARKSRREIFAKRTDLPKQGKSQAHGHRGRQAQE